MRVKSEFWDAIEFRAARKAMDHTQHSLAEALQMGKHGWQTISSWETGRTPIPGPVQIAMECLLHHPPITAEQTGGGKHLGKTPSTNRVESRG